jgi:hypothetical protein
MYILLPPFPVRFGFPTTEKNPVTVACSNCASAPSPSLSHLPFSSALGERRPRTGLGEAAKETGWLILDDFFGVLGMVERICMYSMR